MYHLAVNKVSLRRIELGLVKIAFPIEFIVCVDGDGGAGESFEFRLRDRG